MQITDIFKLLGGVGLFPIRYEYYVNRIKERMWR